MSLCQAVAFLRAHGEPIWFVNPAENFVCSHMIGFSSWYQRDKCRTTQSIPFCDSKRFTASEMELDPLHLRNSRIPVLIGVDVGYLGRVKNSKCARGRNAVVMTLMFM